MSWISSLLNQTITYWSVTPDGYGGYTFGTPVQILGRWEDKVEAFVNPTGVQQYSQAVVYTETDLAPEGYVFLGTSVASDPTTVSGAQRILDYAKTPDLEAGVFLRKVML